MIMSNLPDTVSLIRTLLREPSISSAQPKLDCSNLRVVETLGDWLESLGFAVDIQSLQTDPQKANLIATMGTGPGGLVLAGHTDTVPYDESRWSMDPFSGTVKDGRLYGLGSCDMKAFLALAVQAASAYRGRHLQAPLIILGTADEESSMLGAQALAAAGRPKARYAMIGEPTGMHPVRMHKGIMMERIRVIGASGHSSDPALGRNALEGMHKVMEALLGLRQELQNRYSHPGFKVRWPTLNLGHIHGGDNPNRICGECELHIDLRLLPGMEIEEQRARLRERCAEALRDTGLELDYEALFDGVPPMETASASEIVRLAERLTGHAAEAVNFGTEGPYLNQMGMETVILGPGDIDQAHQPDEYLSLDRIAPTLELLHGLINHFCLQDNPAIQVH